VNSQLGIHLSISKRKPILTGFIKNHKTDWFLVQNLIFEIWRGGIKNRAGFLVYRAVFWFIDLFSGLSIDFQLVFYLKIKF
jgi:hypothetical protein